MGLPREWILMELVVDVGTHSQTAHDAIRNGREMPDVVLFSCTKIFGEQAYARGERGKKI